MSPFILILQSEYTIFAFFAKQAKRKQLLRIVKLKIKFDDLSQRCIAIDF